MIIVNVAKGPSQFNEGRNVGGIPWINTYRVYDVGLENMRGSGITIDNVSMGVRFPGIFIKKIESDLMSQGCDLRPWSSLNFVNLGGIKEVSGRIIISCKSLAPGERVEAKIIVDHPINDCDFGGNFLPSPFNDFNGAYLWYKDGVPIEKLISGRIKGNEDELKAVWVNYGRCIRKSIEKSGSELRALILNNGLSPFLYAISFKYRSLNRLRVASQVP